MRLNFERNEVIGGAIILVVGLLAGFFVGSKYEQRILSRFYLGYINPIRESNQQYKLIKPLLAYKIPPATGEQEFRILHDDAKDYIDNQKKNGNITRLSLFVNEPDRGRWVGINENEKFSPASLMKVAIMTAYFKKSETAAGVLDQRIMYSKQFNDLVQAGPFESPSNLNVGTYYTIGELIKKTIVDSNNGAMALLLDNISDPALNDIFNDLGIPVDTGGTYLLSPRDYSLFFRVLYNATYLDKPTSEKALELLTQTTFKDGLRSGVPKDTIVAEKYGEHVNTGSQAPVIEFSDCGIVYYQPSPYFICIMSEGSDIDKLKSAISGLSSLVYSKIAKK